MRSEATSSQSNSLTSPVQNAAIVLSSGELRPRLKSSKRTLNTPEIELDPISPSCRNNCWYSFIYTSNSFFPLCLLSSKVESIPNREYVHVETNWASKIAINAKRIFSWSIQILKNCFSECWGNKFCCLHFVFQRTTIELYILPKLRFFLALRSNGIAWEHSSYFGVRKILQPCLRR